MSIIERPKHVFSFTDWSRRHPHDPIPPDRLDAQIRSLVASIETTQAALADVRRDDGKLQNGAVGTEQLRSSLINDLLGGVAHVIDPIASGVRGVADSALQSERSAQLYAKDAEAAATVSRQLLSDLTVLRERVNHYIAYIQNTVSGTSDDAREAENWANYSKAQADNAIAAKHEALAWAEFLAGPVVDAAKAPAYIADSPFPHGLYYQPVEGGVAGLWSSKWWALQAQSIVGTISAYYLGGWPAPPLPGEVNPDTGQAAPSPIKPGSIYYDTTGEQVYVWNGTQWVQPLAVSTGYTAQYVYLATAGQTVFSGADLNGATPNVGTSSSNVHLNGIMLVPGDDFTVAGDALTIAYPVTAGSTVQWDLLVSPQAFGGHVNAYKVAITPAPDGATQNFTMTYIDPVDGEQPTTIGSGAQLMVSLDGCVQEPGASFTASGSDLHFAQPPHATASLWGVWYKLEAEG